MAWGIVLNNVIVMLYSTSYITTHVTHHFLFDMTRKLLPVFGNEITARWFSN